ncbi:MAG: type 4a pilus biogenesis protein PilO [Rhodocyclaceae bacterium]|nr:type 4a pilus biogenesis protein PilO [Rhodocyclaceae bacterium]
MATSSLNDKIKSVDLQRLAQDFQGLDPNDPGVWPLAPRIAAFIATFVAVVAAAWWFDWKPLGEQLEAAQATEFELKQKWTAKKRQAVNLDVYREQLAEIDREFGALLRRLPNKAEMDSLLADINQAGLGRGLLFELFRPDVDVIHDFYAEMPINIVVAGSFHDLGAFAQDITQMPRIVTLKDVRLAMDKKAVMRLTGKAVTYRYLDDDELAANQTPAKGK